jgi:hypothetical protein
MSAGIQVLPDIFDSRNLRLQAALGRNPSHLGLDSIKGTGIQVFAAGAHSAEETLLTIKHGLGYKPKVLTYFYQTSKGGYNIGIYFYGFGAIDDYFTYSVDENNLYIKHKLVDNTASQDYTSTAPTAGNIKVKYMIFSNKVNDYTNDAVQS